MGWNRPARPEVLNVLHGQGETRVGRLCRQRADGFSPQDLRVAFRAQVDDELARVNDVLETERADRRGVRADGVHDAQVAVVFRRRQRHLEVSDFDVEAAQSALERFHQASEPVVTIECPTREARCAVQPSEQRFAIGVLVVVDVQVRATLIFRSQDVREPRRETRTGLRRDLEQHRAEPSAKPPSGPGPPCRSC